MPKVFPSQVVLIIDEWFPHAEKGIGVPTLGSAHSAKFRAILGLIKEIPHELMTISPEDYGNLVLALSTIETFLGIWAGGLNTSLPVVQGVDAVTAIRRAIALCPNEYPPPSTTELLFISDIELRESIRGDVGAAGRALQNAEWKAATVLAGATIEALLHWRLGEASPGNLAVQASLSTLISSGVMSKPRQTGLDWWDLHHFIEVALHLRLIEPHTAIAARQAKDFRNLIHPGKAVRQSQLCDRATSYSAIGALEHVIRDLTP